MNLRYTLTRDMLIQLTEFLLMRGPGFAEAQWTARKRSGLWMAFWLFCLFSYAVISLVSDQEGFRFWILPSFFFFGMHLYHILFDTSRALKLVHERAVREVDRRPADERTEEVDFQATADYFLVSTPRARLALRPDQIKQIYYDDQLLYLFYQSDRAVVVPQAAFAGEEARNALFNHLYRLNPPLYQATHRLALKDLIPKEGFFDSPVKIVAASLAAIGLGAVLLLMASPLIFERMLNSAQITDKDWESVEYDLTSHLPQVDDAETLLQLSRDENQPGMFWTPVTETSGPKKEIRCQVTLIRTEDSTEASPGQLAAFSALKNGYQELKPQLMSALLAAYRERRASWSIYADDPEEAKDLPEINSPEEMAEHLTLKSWTLHRLNKNGTAFVNLVYSPDWDKNRFNNDFGVLLLGDEIIYAGRAPYQYLALDLNREPLPEPEPDMEFIPDPMAAPEVQSAPAAVTN